MHRAASMKIYVQLLEGSHRKKRTWQGKNIENSARFRTALDFDRKYPRNGSNNRQAKNGVATAIIPPVFDKKRFGEL